jgi:[ribosomal protein S5]-alanine N-acetyltransferase
LDELLVGRRIRLERLGVARARALVAGDFSGLDAAPGWPHDDTLDGVRIEAEHAESDEQTGFLVVLVASGQVIGDAGWKGGPDDDGVAEIGYGLAAPSRGQGLGSELVGLLATWALAQPGVLRLVAEVLPGNLPSRKALERNRFFMIDEGLSGQSGEYLVYALDR